MILMSNSPVITLKKGKYLAPKYQTHDFGYILFSKTYNEIAEAPPVWHKHENPMVSMVLYGGNLESRKNKQISRSNGSINFYHAHEYHKNDYRVFPSVHLGIEVEQTFLKRYSYNESSIENALLNSQEATFLLLKLLHEASINDDTSTSTSEMLLLSFLETSKREYLAENPSSWMNLVKEILNDNWNISMSLMELGHQVGVHPVTISKNFRKFFNCTYGEYMRKIRVQKAVELILLKKYSLSEIAYECGFSDQSHFIRVFKSYTGILPKTIGKI